MTRTNIQVKIQEDDRWLFRAILAIYKRQTVHEQQTDRTVERNGIGFNGVDAPFLSSLACQINCKGYLSMKQKVIARKMMTKYCGQLERIANGR